MANYLKRYPGDQDLVQRLIEMKNQAQLTGQVNPDLAPIVAGSLADQRQQNYQDAMLGIQEKGLTLAQAKQAAQESQFAQSLAQSGKQFDLGLGQKGQQFSDTLALNKQITEAQIAAANRARIQSYVNTGLGAALGAAEIATYDPNKYKRLNTYNPNTLWRG